MASEPDRTDPQSNEPEDGPSNSGPATSSLATDQTGETQQNPQPTSTHPNRPTLSNRQPLPRANAAYSRDAQYPPSRVEDQLSPEVADRVFPIRSVISVDPSQTPSTRQDKHDGYFQTPTHARRTSMTAADDLSQAAQSRAGHTSKERQTSPRSGDDASLWSQQTSAAARADAPSSAPAEGHSQQYLNDIISHTSDVTSERGARSTTGSTSEQPLSSARAPSIKSTKSAVEDPGPLVTARFKHVISEDGHAVITGRDGDTLQRCEDEPIHIPGAIQGFGLLIALEEQQEGKLVVRIVSENSKRLTGYTPAQLFALDSFTDILTEEQADNLLDHVDFIRDEQADVVSNGPEVFTMSIRTPHRKSIKFWCAMHINERNPNLLICEFELEDDPINPLIPPNDAEPELPEDTLQSQPTEEELFESTQNSSKPLRVLRSARKRKGEAAAMEVFNILSQVQEQLAAAPNLEKFLKILVGVVRELTGFHRVMIYQFDQSWNGRVVTELVDPRVTRDLYKGLHFPASDIPQQARDLYKINKVRMLYDRDQETARLVCRTVEDIENPLDMTHSYLRAMSPIHIKYLNNMAVRSSMSISISVFEELWGLISCHSYGSKGMRVSFPIRKMCRLVGDSASRNIERLSYASRLQARKLINTVPTQSNPSGYIIASSEDLLKLFDADFGLLSIRDETKILGHLEHSQEALAMLEYLRVRSLTSVTTSLDIKDDFPDLQYAPGFKEIAGLLLVPLSVSGRDFIVFFRKGQMREVKWAGNPYEKFIKEGTEGYLEPRKSFRTWSETVVGKCREWTEEEIETAAVLCLVYGKFIDVWRQKEAALQNSHLTRLLLANSAHEVRTPLNAIINYLEIALEGTLDQETRDNLAKSHSASKSLIYVINDLLDLTKTEEGGELIKGEVFDLNATLSEATDMFQGDAKRKNLYYEIEALPGLPKIVIGDQRRVRQAISNVTANAIQNTNEGGIKVEMRVASRSSSRVDIEVSVSDTGVGINSKKLDSLFREMEQVQSETENMLGDAVVPDNKSLPESTKTDTNKIIGLGLAVVARIVRNMNGQLRLKSEEGKGSRFVIQFPFDLPDSEPQQPTLEAADSSVGSTTPQPEDPTHLPTGGLGEITLIDGASAARGDASIRSFQAMSRRASAESFGSKKSLGSVKSGRSNRSLSSNRSGRSEADRLIEAIQEPRRLEGRQDSGRHSRRPSSRDVPSRPILEQRHSTTALPSSSGRSFMSRPKSTELPASPMSLHEVSFTNPGEIGVMDQGTPIRPIKVHDDDPISPTAERSSPTARFASSSSMKGMLEKVPPPPQEPLDSEHMRVLVAEDDPVNSRIIKKRLEKLGHEVFLTINGEECSSAYCDRTQFFDIILMDMQVWKNEKYPSFPPLSRSAKHLYSSEKYINANHCIITDAHRRWSHLGQNDPVLRENPFEPANALPSRRT